MTNKIFINLTKCIIFYDCFAIRIDLCMKGQDIKPWCKPEMKTMQIKLLTTTKLTIKTKQDTIALNYHWIDNRRCPGANSYQAYIHALYHCWHGWLGHLWRSRRLCTDWFFFLNVLLTAYSHPGGNKESHLVSKNYGLVMEVGSVAMFPLEVFEFGPFLLDFTKLDGSCSKIISF